MKFIHLSDLHLGKRVNEFSMLGDQAFILDQILCIIREEHPDAVLIAGDVYDKSIPSAEAISLFDDFLTRLSALKFPVCLISGNHDSAERLSFGSHLMSLAGVHISPIYDGHVEPLVFHDDNGDVNVYMLPFLKPIHVRACFPEEKADSWSDALRVAIRHLHIDPYHRNLLVTHQFVTGAERSDSEDISVGGTDNVDASVFADFDYVALGHIHRPQDVPQDVTQDVPQDVTQDVTQDVPQDNPSCKTGPVIRYCGSPLKYSFSEASHTKSVTVVEMAEKGNVAVRTKALTPLRDLKEIKGQYNDLMAQSYYEGTDLRDSYLHITLTDEMDVPEAMARLRTVYPYLMKLDYDNTRTRAVFSQAMDAAPEDRSPLELFSLFFEKQNGSPMSEEQSAYIRSLLEDLGEENP